MSWKIGYKPPHKMGGGGCFRFESHFMDVHTFRDYHDTKTRKSFDYNDKFCQKE